MPATPMNEAAERYSPEMAEAFQPTDTERPATKKSLAVLDVLAERKPIQIVTTTVINENAKIQGSTPPSQGSQGSGRESVMAQRFSFPPRRWTTSATSSSSSAIERLDEDEGDDPDEGKNSTPMSSQLSV
jgi:hypothetical protein